MNKNYICSNQISVVQQETCILKRENIYILAKIFFLMKVKTLFFIEV